MKSVLLALALLVAFLAYALAGAGDFKFGLNGWIAWSLGSVISVILAAGLMALMVHSDKHGYDDRVRDPPDDPA